MRTQEISNIHTVIVRNKVGTLAARQQYQMPCGSQKVIMLDFDLNALAMRAITLHTWNNLLSSKHGGLDILRSLA